MLPFRITIRRPLGAIVAVASLALSACADSTAPTTMRSGYITAATDHAAPAVASNTTIDFKKLYPGMAIIKPAQKIVGDTVIQMFKIDPAKGIVVQFGRNTHYVAIPARTVCNPATSGYGPSSWLSSCTLATSGIDVNVKSWTGANGRPYVDFSPDLRFSPTAIMPVTLYFRDPLLFDFSNVVIPYCNSGNACVNEGAGDPLQTTFAAPATGGGYWVFRALRHFSGYNVTAF